METHQRHTQPHGVRLQHDLRGEVQDMLGKLAQALVRGDGAAVAELWEVPALVIGSDVIGVTSSEQVEKFFGAAKDQYTHAGIGSTRADIIDLERVGDRIVIVTVRWPYLDDHGHEVGAESSDYTLRRDDAGRLRIRAVLMRGVEPGSRTTMPA
jgi:hypothetical protein